MNDGSSTIVGVTDRPVLVTGDGHNRFGQPLDLTDGPVDARLISTDMAPDGSIAVAWVAGGWSSAVVIQCRRQARRRARCRA